MKIKEIEEILRKERIPFEKSQEKLFHVRFKIFKVPEWSRKKIEEIFGKTRSIVYNHRESWEIEIPISQSEYIKIKH